MHIETGECRPKRIHKLGMNVEDCTVHYVSGCSNLLLFTLFQLPQSLLSFLGFCLSWLALRHISIASLIFLGRLYAAKGELRRVSVDAISTENADKLDSTTLLWL
jgi:hypothetical protein